MIDAIDDKLSSIMYEFTNDESLKALGIKEELLAIEDDKKHAPTIAVEGVDKETYPPHVSYMCLLS